MDENEKRWLKRIADMLVGRKIVSVNYMTDEHKEDNGWFHRPIEIHLDDGNCLTPMQDDEGNDGGALSTWDKETPTIPVF